MTTTRIPRDRGRNSDRKRAGQVEQRTDQDRYAEVMGISTDVRYCACGCGQKLRAGTPATYVRGHRLGKVASDSSVKDPDRGKAKPISYPGGKIPEALHQDLKDKLDFLLTLIGTGWETRDPICGPEFTARSDQIAEKLIT